MKALLNKVTRFLLDASNAVSLGSIYQKYFLFKEILYTFVFLQFHNPSQGTDTLKTDI